jgi:hypothetical protein
MNARICSLASVFAAGVLLAHAPAATAISTPVNCGGVQVGTLTVFDGFPIGAEFTANSPAFPTLADAAKQCGEDHFNWYQVVIADNKQPLDAGGKPLTSPYIDPPPGGYLDSNPATAGNQTLWADNLPWYWNEGAAPPAGTPGFDPQTMLGANTSATTLTFGDVPGGASTNILFKTWLVSLNADSSFHSFHPGFTWNFIADADNNPTVVQVRLLTAAPTAAEFQNLTGGFATSVPEPSTAVTVVIGASGLLALGLHRRRASRSATTG